MLGAGAFDPQAGPALPGALCRVRCPIKIDELDWTLEVAHGKL